jgi:hypothetical protein
MEVRSSQFAGSSLSLNVVEMCNGEKCGPFRVLEAGSVHFLRGKFKFEPAYVLYIPTSEHTVRDIRHSCIHGFYIS